MDRRYQVFISSTFADLEDERKAIMEALLELDCFPAGMEMFPASDDEQFEYIKRVIDESDYYVLVVSGRYGSEADDGKSYTEKEFEYALEKRMPVLVFISEDMENIPVKKTDQDEKKKKKLMKFRDKVIEKRLAKFWKNKDDLKFKVHSSLSKEFKVKPRIGWIRGNVENNEQLLKQLNEIRQERDELKNKLEKIRTQIQKFTDPFEGKNIIVHYRDCITDDFDNEIEFTWTNIFVDLGRKMYDEQRIYRAYINTFLEEKIINIRPEENNIQIDDNDIFKIIAMFKRLGLIYDDQGVFWLESKGQELLFDLVLEK